MSTGENLVPPHLLAMLRTMADAELEGRARDLRGDLPEGDITPEAVADLRQALAAYEAINVAHPLIGDEVRYLAARTVQWESGDDGPSWPASRNEARLHAERLRHLTELMEIGGVA